MVSLVKPMKKKFQTCHNCKERIMFTKENGRWLKVEPFEPDGGERELMRVKVGIPFDPNRHTRHFCRRKEDNHNNVYRG